MTKKKKDKRRNKKLDKRQLAIGTTFPVVEQVGHIRSATVEITIECPYCHHFIHANAIVGMGMSVDRMGNCAMCHNWFTYDLTSILGSEASFPRHAIVRPVLAELKVSLKIKKTRKTQEDEEE